MHPSTSLATLRPDLVGSFMEWTEEAAMMDFIGLRVLPPVEVNKPADRIGLIPIEQLLQEPNVDRAPGAPYTRNRFTFTDFGYSTRDRGFEEAIDDNEARRYNQFFEAELLAAMRARQIVQRAAEKRISAAVFNTTTWTGAALTTAVTTPWSTAGSAVPIDDVDAAKKKVFEGSGLWPNAVIMDRYTFMAARKTTQVKEVIASSGAGESIKAANITAAMLAQVFDVALVLVAGSPKNTANEGQAATIASIWNKNNVMVARIATTQDHREPCIGRTFHWGEDGSQIGGIIETYRDERVRGEAVRCRHEVDEVIVYKEAGHLLTNTHA